MLLRVKALAATYVGWQTAPSFSGCNPPGGIAGATWHIVGSPLSRRAYGLRFSSRRRRRRYVALRSTDAREAHGTQHAHIVDVFVPLVLEAQEIDLELTASSAEGTAPPGAASSLFADGMPVRGLKILSAGHAPLLFRPIV